MADRRRLVKCDQTKAFSNGVRYVANPCDHLGHKLRAGIWWHDAEGHASRVSQVQYAQHACPQRHLHVRIVSLSSGSMCPLCSFSAFESNMVAFRAEERYAGLADMLANDRLRQLERWQHELDEKFLNGGSTTTD